MADDAKLQRMFAKPAALPDIPDQDDGEDVDPAKCFARACVGRQGVPMVCIRKIDGTRPSFAYHGIAPLDLLDVHVEFIATTPDGRVWQVTIRGRNLVTIHDSIFDGKCIWVQALRDMEAARAPATATVVKSLEWSEVADGGI